MIAYNLKKFTINTLEADLLKDLKQTAKKLGGRYISNKQYAEHGGYNPSTLMRRFGSWNNALKLAGLKVKKTVNAPEEELMLNIKRVWDTLKKQPRYTQMQKPLSRFDVRVYTNRYGSWNNALDEFIKFIRFIKSNKFLKMKNSKKFSRKRRKTKSDNLTNLKNLRNLKNCRRHISKGMRFDVMKRDNYKCKLCGASPATDPKVTLHIDHIIPRSKGGETTPKNLQTLCSECNLGKGSKLLGISPP